MAIALPALLKLANFPKDQVDQLMKDIDFVTEEEKIKLADTAWFLLSQKYFLRLNFEQARVLDEVKQGKRKYNPNDFEEIKARLIHEFTHKLEAAENQESIEEVKKQLEKFKTKPFSQDK